MEREHQHETSESGVRTTRRIKKPKTVFDPSDNYLSRAQRTASAIAASVEDSKLEHHTTPTMATATMSTATLSTLTNVTPTGETSPVVDFGKGFDTCMKCLKTEPRRGKGFKSKFLQCRICTKKWHINCIKIQFECYRLARDKYKCENCRNCRVCSRKKNAKKLPKNSEVIVCTMCVDAFHVDCHIPSILKSQVTDGSFKCSKCEFVPPDKKAKNDPSKRSTTPDESTNSLEIPESSLAPPPEMPSSAPPVEQIELELRTDTESIKRWTVDDVVRFFSKHHPPDDAEVFRVHEIDGASLLLLKRSQVIKRFKLKLGPVLRLYESIVILQTQEDNIMNAWND